MQRAIYEHAIAVLTGHPPADLTIPHAPLTSAVPVLPPGLPSTLLERRPDIAAAERAMQEENALIGVQVAAFYPDISLSTLGGFIGNPLSQLFTTANRVWSLGASASETLFEGGARTAAVAAARATYDQSVANYRQVVLTALQQVEDEVSSLRILEQQERAEASRRCGGAEGGGCAVQPVSRGDGGLYQRGDRANDAAGGSAVGAGGAAEPPGGERDAGDGAWRWMEHR